MDEALDLLVGCGTWGLIGGSERYALEIVPALAERGHRVTVLYGRGEPGELPGVRFEQFPPLAELVARPEAPFDGAALESLLGRVAPGIVYQLTPTAPWIVHAMLRAAPFVRFVQDHTLFCPGLNKLRADGTPCRAPMGSACVRAYLLEDGCVGLRPDAGRRPVLRPFRKVAAKRRELALHRRARLLIVGSDYMRGELLAAGMNPDRVVAVPYTTRAATGAIEAASPPPDTAAFLRRTGGPLIFTPARLTLPDKGVDYLLTALTLLQPGFRAVIGGSGPAEEWLREKAAAEGLEDRVHFAGWLTSEQVEGLYAAADVVAFPSVWDEPFGLVGIEAMAHGTPVVAFDVGGVREWLEDGAGGFLVPRRDVAAMADALSVLLRDPRLRERMGACGREIVERSFRPAARVERLESLLRSAARGVLV